MNPTAVLDVDHLLPLADRRDSLVGSIAEWVGRAIIEGRLKPGDDLNSVELSKRYNTSRTPVREALLLLEKEGLVEIRPRHRPRVASISAAEVRGIYLVRTALYALVAETIARTASDAAIATLQRLSVPLVEAAASHDVDAYFWASEQFNEFEVGACDNAPLKRIVHSLGLRVLQLRHLSLSQPGRLAQSADDHVRYVRALEQRDVRLAVALRRSIIMASLAAIERSGWMTGAAAVNGEIA